MRGRHVIEGALRSMAKKTLALLALLLTVGYARQAEALEAGAEETYLRVLAEDHPSADPETYDGDENGIVDRVQFRLLDTVLRENAAPHHALILGIYTVNLLRIQQGNPLSLAECFLFELLYGFTCDDYERYAAAQLTIAEPEAVDALVLGIVQRLGLFLNQSDYDLSAGAYLNASGDLDGDGYSNLEEFEAVCGDFDGFIEAAMAPGLNPATLPCCQNCPLEITEQPEGARKYTGDAHTFSVTVANIEGEVRYRWFKDDELIGANAPILSFPALVPADSGGYWCEISDDRGALGVAVAVSVGARLTVADHMAIVEQPSAATRVPGDTYTFRVDVSGGFDPLSHQWFHNGRTVATDTPVLALDYISEGDGGVYRCEISDAFETIVTETVQLTVLASCYASPCLSSCASEGMTPDFEGALRRIYDIQLLEEPPDEADYDDNGIVDVAHARLVESILMDPALPMHCCVVSAYNYNYAQANILADQVPPFYFDLFVPREFFVTTAAGLMTVGEKATMEILVAITNLLPGIPTVDPSQFDNSCEQWLAFNGDADLDGVCNLSEYFSVVSGPEDFDAFVSVALDSSIREDAGGCETCGGYKGILLAGESFLRMAFWQGAYDAVLDDYGYGRYTVVGSTTTSNRCSAKLWAKNEDNQLGRIDLAFELYPTIEIVHLMIGVSDIFVLAEERSLDSLSASRLDSYLSDMQDNIQTVVDYILALRPDLVLLLVDYDYLDPFLMSEAFDIEFESTSQWTFNNAMIQLGRKKMEIAARTDRCYYIQNWGLLQYRLGNPPVWEPGGVPFPGAMPDYAPYPGGNPNYSSTAAAYVDGNGFLPTYEGQYWIFENCFNQFYADWLIPDEGEGEGEAEPVWTLAIGHKGRGRGCVARENRVGDDG